MPIKAASHEHLAQRTRLYKENGSGVTSRPISPFANPSRDCTISFLGCFFSFHTAAADAADAADADEVAVVVGLVADREVEGRDLKTPELAEREDEARDVDGRVNDDDDDERVDLAFGLGGCDSGCVM